MTRVINDVSSAASLYVRELRDVKVQKDSHRFRRNLERLGMMAGYELSQLLNYKDTSTITPLGTANTKELSDEVVVCTVLRAGLPLQHGILQVLDQAVLAFIGAARKPETGTKVEVALDYLAAPPLRGRVLVLADTMLATGTSLVDSYNALVETHGQPAKTFIVAVIASQTGVDYVTKNIPGAELLVFEVDEELNDKFYIVPGLGDAGDLLYGPKL